MAYGGFTHDDWYTMPIQLRTFYVRKLIKDKEKEKARYEAEKMRSEAKANTPSFARGPSVEKR